jgi:hypothetical protein
MQVTDLPVFRLFASKVPSGSYEPTEADGKQARAEMARLGGRLIIACQALSMPWWRFGIEQWPDFGAIAAYTSWIRNFQRAHDLSWDALNLTGVVHEG